MKKLNVGLIGGGSISECHTTAYKNNPDVNLYAFCDFNAQRAEERMKQHGAQRFVTDYRELLADPELDAVSICTWNNTHAEIAIAALEAGKHVLVEKPLCRTMDEAHRIEAAVRKSGRNLQVGYVRRFAPNSQLLKKFIDAGDLGEIYYAKASFIRRLGNPGGWFADRERSGGGPLIDLGVHIIDICWYMMGKPKVKSVSGNTYNKLGNRANIQNLSFYKAADYSAEQNNVEDCANALIRFENGASLMVDVSFTLHAKKDEMGVKLYGTKGGAELEPELMIVTEKNDTILNVHPQVDHLSMDFDKSFQNEIDHFVACCLGQEEPISPVEDGVEVMKMLCAIYESAEKGIEISFE